MSKTVKPPALAKGSALRVISPASHADRKAVFRGIAEIERQGYCVRRPSRPMKVEGYFAGSLAVRAEELQRGLAEGESDALICARGGYGSTALIEGLRLQRTARPKLLIGFSDITVLQVYLWMRYRWTTLYGPMAAAGWDKGEGHPGGYDLQSFVDAASGTRRSWSLDLGGEALVGGSASGVLLGGCITLLQTTLGTRWELDTRGAVLVLEDCLVKPYQLDRMLEHWKQAGKFRGVRGVILNDFPGADGSHNRRAAFREVCLRVLGPLQVPMVFGAAVGHTSRPMLTLPLGVRVTLRAQGKGRLDILEPAVTLENTAAEKAPADGKRIKIVRPGPLKYTIEK